LDNNLAAFIPNTKIIYPDFALLGLSLIDMATMVQPGAVPSMDTEAFYNFRIPLPDYDRQVAFVSDYREFRKRLLAISGKAIQSIDRLREYRAALITAAVTGQIDVDTYGKSGVASEHLDRIDEGMRA
jgi:type I restriction enzyme, S subunit